VIRQQSTRILLKKDLKQVEEQLKKHPEKRAKK
jgi:hypothetical protein